MIEQHDYLFKIVLVGNQGVGKSSLFARYCDQNFADNYLPTIGVDFRFKKQEFEGSVCKLQIWDTAGQERFRTITSAYYRSAQAVLIIFDLNDPQSFEEIEDYWLTQAKNNISDEAIIFIIGNKCDMEHAVLDGRIEQFSREAGVKNYNVSAKTGQNVEQMFFELCGVLVEKTKMMKPLKNEKSKNSYKINIQPEKKERKKRCCK